MNPKIGLINFPDRDRIQNDFAAHFSKAVVSRLQDIHKEEAKLIFYYVPSNDANANLELRKLVEQFGHLNIVPVSEHLEVSLMAWRLHCLYFILMPMSKLEFKVVFQRWKQINAPEENEHFLQFRDEQGVQKIKSKEILVVKAEGNYSHLFLQNGKDLLVSKQIQFIDQMLEENPAIVRIGRSFMINLSLIKSVRQNEVGFTNSEYRLKLSPTYTRRVKKLFVEFIPV